MKRKGPSLLRSLGRQQEEDDEKTEKVFFMHVIRNPLGVLHNNAEQPFSFVSLWLRVSKRGIREEIHANLCIYWIRING